MLQNITRIEYGKIETIEKMKFHKKNLQKRNSKMWKQNAPKHNENRTWKNGLSRLKLIPEWKKIELNQRLYSISKNIWVPGRVSPTIPLLLRTGVLCHFTGFARLVWGWSNFECAHPASWHGFRVIFVLSSFIISFTVLLLSSCSFCTPCTTSPAWWECLQSQPTFLSVAGVTSPCGVRSAYFAVLGIKITWSICYDRAADDSSVHGGTHHILKSTYKRESTYVGIWVNTHTRVNICVTCLHSSMWVDLEKLPCYLARSTLWESESSQHMCHVPLLEKLPL